MVDDFAYLRPVGNEIVDNIVILGHAAFPDREIASHVIPSFSAGFPRLLIGS
jgi:hypothetical protein